MVLFPLGCNGVRGRSWIRTYICSMVCVAENLAKLIRMMSEPLIDNSTKSRFVKIVFRSRRQKEQILS